MALCRTGGEAIERDTESGEWHSIAASDQPHTEHAPRLTIVVEPAPMRQETCEVCAWGSSYATLCVGGVLVCDDHAVSAIKLQHAMMAR